MVLQLDVPPASSDPDRLTGLLEAIAADTGRAFQHSQTLPPESYVSDAFFALESKKIFKPGWICIGHSSQLAAPGDYFTLDLLDELLVVVRGRDHTIRTLSRVCPHRWAPLASGRGNAKRFSCPFHKWAFDLTGKLLGAPLMELVDFCPQDQSLPAFRTEIVDGFIYVNLSGNAEPLTPQLQGLSARLARFNLGELVVAGERHYDCQFNWKIMVETFMECYHHIAAHPETFETAFPARLSYVEEGQPAWTSCIAPAREAVPDSDILIGTPWLGEDVMESDARSFQLFLVYPFHLINVWADRVYWFCSQPVSANRTLLQTYILLRPEARGMPLYDEMMEKEMAFMDRVNQEDFAVNNMQQIGARTGTARPGRLSHLEKAVWQLADYVREKIL
jgi:phenylpropionate dioxygenase-like ring-hydroxylating dioxygenase large terminal subunit